MIRLIVTMLSAIALLSISITPTASQSVETLYGSTAPTNAPGSDANSIEVGLRFYTAVGGDLYGIRFYKHPSAIGVHTGHIWDASGNLLTSVTFSNESANGWQEAVLGAPINLLANTTYTVSYHTSYYRATINYGFPQVSGNLHSVTPNGVYTYGASAAYPTNSFSNANYWVDVLFTSGAQPTSTPTAVATSTATSGATATPTPTPLPLGDYCTEIVGFSVTESWFNNGFYSSVPNPSQWQLRWFSGGSIDQWAAGSFFTGWTDSSNLSHTCAVHSGHPDRVILNVSGNYSNNPEYWRNYTQQTVDYIQNTYAPSATIILQPPVGAISGALCTATDTSPNPPYNRASYNYRPIVDGLYRVTGTTVGALPQIDCGGYSDSVGHISSASRVTIGTNLASYYTAVR